MDLGTSNRQTLQGCLSRMLLVVALMFAAWHVASHDVDIASDHEECQACRLNHVPITDLPVLSLLVSLLLASLILVIPAFQRPTQAYRYTLGARAPPLS